MTVTLTKARRDLMAALGPFQLVSSGVQQTPPTGTYLGRATGADAARIVVSSDIADLDFAGTGADTDTAWWNGGFAYLLNTVPEQRRIVRDSYNPNQNAEDVTDQTTTGYYAGTVTLNRPLATSIATGITVELSGVLPPLNWDRGVGMHACINQALMSMPMEFSVSITGTGLKLVDLTTAIPWLYRQDQFIGCYDKAADSDTLGRNHPGIDLEHPFEFNGQTVTLVSDEAFTNGDVFTLKLWRPVGTWINVSGTWASSTVGLVNETDEAMADPKIVELCAMYYAYKALARIHKGIGQGDYYRSQLPDLAALAAPYLRLDNDLHPEQRTTGTGVYAGVGYPGSDSGSSSWP